MADPRFVLALDTSDAYLTVALETPNGVHVYQEQVKTAAQVALSVIHDLCVQADCTLSDIECFVVTTGPGRFAGMRTSIALIQSLAWGLKQPVIAVPTLHAWAFSAREQLYCEHVWVCMDARMHEWAYQWFEGSIQAIEPVPKLANAEALDVLARAPGCPDVLVGTGLDHACFQSPAFSQINLVSEFQLVPQDLVRCAKHWPHQDPLSLRPCYLRPSVV